MAITVHYQISDGALLGYTRRDPPTARQIPDPLPAGTATKYGADLWPGGTPVENQDPGKPQEGTQWVWNPGTLTYGAAIIQIGNQDAEWVFDTLGENNLAQLLEGIYNPPTDGGLAYTAPRRKLHAWIMRLQSLPQNVELSASWYVSGITEMEAAGFITAGKANALKGI